MKFRMCKISKQLKTIIGTAAIAGAVVAAPVSASMYGMQGMNGMSGMGGMGGWR